MIRSARKSKLTRPINQLTFICKKSECTNVNIEVFDVDQTRPERGEFAQQVSDEFLGEDEIFVENQGDDNEVDHNLDDMIIADKPMEITDEIIESRENINDKKDNGEVSNADKVDLTEVEETADEIMENNDYNDTVHNNGEIINADEIDENIVDMEDVKQEETVERHQEDEQAPRRSARNRAKPKVDYNETHSSGRRRTRRR